MIFISPWLSHSCLYFGYVIVLSYRLDFTLFRDLSLFGLGFVVVQLVNARTLFQCVLLVFVGIFSFWFWVHWRVLDPAAFLGFAENRKKLLLIWVLDPMASEVNIAP